MSKTKETFPRPGRFKDDKDKNPITVLGRERVGGIDSYRVKDTDGQIRTYGVSHVVLSKQPRV